jgi:hypothetical protein
MNLIYFVLPFLLQILTVVAIVLISWTFIKRDLARLFKPADIRENLSSVADDIEIKKDDNTLLTLRLQAHERLVVFTDRLNPSNLFLRLFRPGISAAELQSVILNEIRQEYQHNVTQQLYVSTENWSVLSKLKEDTLAMINNATAALPPDATGVDLSRKVLEHMAEVKDNPYELTLALIKKDIHQLY